MTTTIVSKLDVRQTSLPLAKVLLQYGPNKLPMVLLTTSVCGWQAVKYKLVPSFFYEAHKK